MRVLVFAFECSPAVNSEPGIAARWAEAYIRDGHDVVVFTHSSQVTASSLACDVVYSTGPLASPRNTVQFGGALKNILLYRGWLAAAREYLRRNIDKFDLVHHVSWSSARLRSPLDVIGNDPIDAKMVWGPLGGGHFAPIRWVTRHRELFELVRNVSVYVSRFKRIRASSTTTLVCNVETEVLLEKRGAQNVLLMPVDGLRDDQVLTDCKVALDGDDLKILWVGRLVASKRPDVSLHALAGLRLSGIKATLTVAGTGPEDGRLRKLADTLEISEYVDWLGWVSPMEMSALYRKADILLYTSVRDSGFISALEAAGQGTPSIGFQHQGFGAGYQVGFDCFVDASPGASSERAGAAFAISCAALLNSDYESVSRECLSLASANLFSARPGELIRLLDQ